MNQLLLHDRHTEDVTLITPAAEERNANKENAFVIDAKRLAIVTVMLRAALAMVALVVLSRTLQARYVHRMPIVQVELHVILGLGFAQNDQVIRQLFTNL